MRQILYMILRLPDQDDMKWLKDRSEENQQQIVKLKK